MADLRRLALPLPAIAGMGPLPLLLPAARLCSARTRRCRRGRICCATADEPPPPAVNRPVEVSSSAKIRGEVLAPFRSVRMFFYLAFIASASLGGLIAVGQLIPSLADPSRAAGDLPDIAKGLGIDVAAVLLFAFLYSSESKAKTAQLAKISREESLSELKLRLSENKVISVGELRGTARLVIVAGPAAYISESYSRSRPLADDLIARGVLAVPYPTDGQLPSLDSDSDSDSVKRLWRLTPAYYTEWAGWLDDQKRMANVSSESPVYLSLRLDGRVRGSGVGYPPWNALVAQLPPVKGMWSGLLDGMDGRVL